MKMESFAGEGILYARPYCAAMRKMGPFLFVNGIVATDSDTGKIIRGLEDLPDQARRKLSSGNIHADAVEGPIMAQSWFIYNILSKLLQSAGSSLENILQALIFIKDMRRNWVAFNRVRMMMIKNPPPSTVIETPCLAISDDLLIEMHIIAGIPDEK